LLVVVVESFLFRFALRLFSRRAEVEDVDGRQPNPIAR